MDGRKARGKWDLAEGVSSRGGEATPVQLLEKADERRGEGVIAQFAPVHPLVLGAPHGVGLEFDGVDGNVKYLVGEPVLKAESCRRKAPPPSRRARPLPNGLSLRVFGGCHSQTKGIDTVLARCRFVLAFLVRLADGRCYRCS